MHELFPRMSAKAGLSPGKAVYVGPQRRGTPGVRLFDYREDAADERAVPREELARCASLVDSDSVTWLDVDGVHDVALLDGLGKLFRLHPLAIEDIANTDQRPKVEDYGEQIFLSLEMLTPSPGNDSFVGEQVSLVLGANYVLSFQEQPGDGFDSVRQRIRDGRGRIRRMGADYLAYCLLDGIVDGYFAVVEEVGDSLSELEEGAADDATSATLEKLHGIRRDLIYLRKKVWPLREALNTLRHDDTPLVRESVLPFLGDVYDHTLSVIESIDALRELANGVKELYHSGINLRMNETMKVLTLIATIFIPLSFVAGVYGMNFKVMPELDLPWGYPAALAVMGVVALGMLVFFRRRRWL